MGSGLVFKHVLLISSKRSTNNAEIQDLTPFCARTPLHFSWKSFSLDRQHRPITAVFVVETRIAPKFVEVVRGT